MARAPKVDPVVLEKMIDAAAKLGMVVHVHPEYFFYGNIAARVGSLPIPVGFISNRAHKHKLSTIAIQLVPNPDPEKYGRSPYIGKYIPEV